jgi:GTP-dependent dephospho-CoA kinase
MRAGATHSASSEERVWVVPEALRPTLAERYGPVFTGPEAELRMRALATFGTAGDRVTATAIALGKLPLVGIVDYKTRRNEPVDPAAFAPLAARRKVRVKNPPGMLTERLRRAVRELVVSGGGLVEVDGEEDLGALALVEALPAGATVIYGIPGEGVSFVAVDAVSKEHVRALIAQMELRRVDLGS